jgi:hypothetical protein
MDIIRLRILNYKSVIGFGKYATCTVQQVIDIHKQRYLIWLYCNIAGISFADEILNHIGLFKEEWRIKKPGTSPSLYEEYSRSLERYIDKEITALGKVILIKKKTSHVKAELNNYNKRVELQYYNKRLLQSKNHGH